MTETGPVNIEKHEFDSRKDTVTVALFGALGSSLLWCKHKTAWLFERFVFYKRKFPIENMIEETKIVVAVKNLKIGSNEFFYGSFQLIGLLHKAKDHWCFDGDLLHKNEAFDWSLVERFEPWLYGGGNIATQTKLNTISAFSHSLNPGSGNYLFSSGVYQFLE